MSDFRDIIGKFFYYYFSANFKKRAMRMTAKGTVDSVRLEMIADMPIQLPCYEEQQKIADFLSSFDEKIEAIRKELEGWKIIKKGFLQQMFC